VTEERLEVVREATAIVEERARQDTGVSISGGSS